MDLDKILCHWTSLPDRFIDEHYYYSHFTTLWILSGTTRVSWYHKTFTHSHTSWSSIILYMLPPSTAIHGILYVQLTCLIFFLQNLCPSLLWSTSWSVTLQVILHTFFDQVRLQLIDARNPARVHMLLQLPPPADDCLRSVSIPTKSTVRVWCRWRGNHKS